MIIEKGLVIDAPWIDKILTGRKVWEMRSIKTKHRGWFALIRKGSGVVEGVARMVDVIGPLTPEQLTTAVDRHAIEHELRPEVWMSKWNIAWMLDDVRVFDRPVPYVHKPGAVTWVRLDDSAIECIQAQLGSSSSA